MTNSKGFKVLRAMKLDKNTGLPKIKHNKSGVLGFRIPVDIEAQDDGLYHPDTGGLSVYEPPVENIHPNFRPPISKLAIWELDTSILVKFDLKCCVDVEDPTHWLVGPVKPVDEDTLVDNLNSTGPYWKKLP